MSKIIPFENVTLDGVMQAPAYKDEDRRGGFEHGGWGPADPGEEAVKAPAGGLDRDRGRPPWPGDLRGLRVGLAEPAGQPVRRVPERDPQVRGVDHAEGTAR